MIYLGHENERRKEMACNFIECNRDQQYLMPPSVKEWLPEGDLSWFVIDVVGQMELKEFYNKY